MGYSSGWYLMHTATFGALGLSFLVFKASNPSSFYTSFPPREEKAMHWSPLTKLTITFSPSHPVSRSP